MKASGIHPLGLLEPSNENPTGTQRILTLNPYKMQKINTVNTTQDIVRVIHELAECSDAGEKESFLEYVASSRDALFFTLTNNESLELYITEEILLDALDILQKERVIKKLSKFSLTRLNKAQVWHSGSCYTGETKESLLSKLLKYDSLSDLSRILYLAQ